MGFLTAKQFSEKWGITERRIIKLCKEERIDGAIKNGMVWLIPEETLKPSDKRRKISEYIQTQKNVVIINSNNRIAENLIPNLRKEGFNILGTYLDGENSVNDLKLQRLDLSNKKDLENFLNNNIKYVNGLILLGIDNKTENLEWFITEFAKKMDWESSIVLVNESNNKNIEINQDLIKCLERNIGVRINSLNLNIPNNRNLIIDYKEIANDIVKLLVGFKNTTGITIESDGGAVEILDDGKSQGLEIGKFYKILNYYFSRLDKNSKFWAASIMLEDEWTEEPLEMNFRIINLEAANRGANIERIFIFSKEKIKEFKENKTLKVYMQNININTMFVDYDEILEKEPELLKIVGNGWDGFNDEALIADMPNDENYRGYVNINKKEIEKAYKCFFKLKEYSKDLREVLL